MRIVVAPDSFKEALPAAEVGRAIERGLRLALPDSEIVCIPMADGGEGTVAVVSAATGGIVRDAWVTGPLGSPVRAHYAVIDAGSTAIIEMASASGLSLAPIENRDPGKASTFGTGELIRHAVEAGARRIVLGIGGSATNDGGAGMAQALGWSLRDSDDRELERGGLALAGLSRIDGSRRLAALDEVEVLVACDVNNPLAGPDGASQIYGPQKGASPEMVGRLDEALAHFGEEIEKHLGISVSEIPGAGAAGGLGAGMVAFAGARLRPGVELVAEAVGLAEALRGADLVITGEGKIDAQSIHGKTPVGVARMAKAAGVPVVALAGVLGEGYRHVYEHGIDAAFCIAPGPIGLDESKRRTAELLEAVAESVGRFWRWKR